MVKLFCLFLVALVYAKEELRGYDFFIKNDFVKVFYPSDQMIFLLAVNSIRWEIERSFKGKRYHISNYHIPNVRILGRVNLLKPKLDIHPSATVKRLLYRKSIYRKQSDKQEKFQKLILKIKYREIYRRITGRGDRKFNRTK